MSKLGPTAPAVTGEMHEESAGIRPQPGEPVIDAELRIELGAESDAARFVGALASLLRGSASHVAARSPAGEVDEPPVEALARGGVSQVRFTMPLDGVDGEVVVSRSSEDPACCVLRAPLTLGAPTRELWLQCLPDVLAPIRVMAVGVAPGALTGSALHTVVALAARSGGFRRATCAALRGEWSPTRDFDAAVPVSGDATGTRWRLQPELEAEAAAWFVGPAEAAEPAAPGAEWWKRLEELASTARSGLGELEAHLGEVFLVPFSWRICDLGAAPAAGYVVPSEVDVLARLVPTEDQVVLAVDLDQPAPVVVDLLLHLCAHCELGHVRAGDRWGHWDTRQTVQTPRRHWDAAVRERLEGLRPARRVTSLEECTPHEKALLGLHRMIGEMLGESRRLHERAVDYQRAAYQRQAAERLVGMLEDHGGGMLCDGVGLGKTYVATTVIIHYANEWIERVVAGRTEDPFRITILAPGSVVSTWQREALPTVGPYGVPLATVRVLSHSKLSRITPKSEILRHTADGPSDLEHLLLSDLVIVDEAHNFRSLSASRTKVLRDLLRLQPRRDQRRRVLLLTATPINNGLDDLRQETSLMFSKPIYPVDARTPEAYRKKLAELVADRCRRASSTRTKGDVSALIAHGDPKATFSDALELRDDLSLGPYVQRVGDYLKEQDKRLREVQETVRAAAQSGQEARAERVRIAEELLDRIVVQRSRALCKEIERQQGGATELLFRRDADLPEKLLYADEYDGISDVLARFLPLFDDETGSGLSFKVYMWYDVREGIKGPRETSPVVGLQRVMALKRLESSPVSFLITLLRLLALHAVRLYELAHLCEQARDSARRRALEKELEAIVSEHSVDARAKLLLLSAGAPPAAAKASSSFVKALADAHASRSMGDAWDVPAQLGLYDDADAGSPVRDKLERLWELREELLRDFSTLLEVTPPLADTIFGKFHQDQWPRRFAADGASIDWPRSPEWGLRIVTDAKLSCLVARLLEARREGQKAIVFSQFSDTVAYIGSVLAACEALRREHWRLVTKSLRVSEDEVRALLATAGAITGATEDRDDAVNAFAPFYRIGPFPPATGADLFGDSDLRTQWERAWTLALERPVDVLFSTDVLAEGVNLQDAALLVNFDVHWNPVRMIQRAGRIDRRLSPRVERAADFPELAQLCAGLGRPAPRYWWHDHPAEAPRFVNMILPDELEEELLLRERIATKTLAIDFTLGLEQGTGAEADWMADYKYQGVTSLNSFQKDRAIEQVAGYHERLRRLMAERGIEPEWVLSWNGWLREAGANVGGPVLAWALLGRKGGEVGEYTRLLTPKVESDVAHWLWTTAKPMASMLNFWLVLDAKTFPAAVRTDLGFSPDASRPISADDLLGAARRLVDGGVAMEELGREVGRPVMQGASAISAGFLGAEPDRRAIQVRGFRILQLRRLDLSERGSPAIERRGMARPCPSCGHPPGMHKCCPSCGESASGAAEVDRAFGFRRLRAADGTAYETPQPWCRSCRAHGARDTSPTTGNEETC